MAETKKSSAWSWEECREIKPDISLQFQTDADTLAQLYGIDTKRLNEQMGSGSPQAGPPAPVPAGIECMRFMFTGLPQPAGVLLSGASLFDRIARQFGPRPTPDTQHSKSASFII